MSNVQIIRRPRRVQLFKVNKLVHIESREISIIDTVKELDTSQPREECQLLTAIRLSKSKVDKYINFKLTPAKEIKYYYIFTEIMNMLLNDYCYLSRDNTTAPDPPTEVDGEMIESDVDDKEKGKHLETTSK